MVERARILKIDDGCVKFLLLLFYSLARGAVRSLPLALADSDTKSLSGLGYRELVLTGIEISSYGQDFQTGPL